jgi:polysaccharide export outer membrane protein
VKIVSTTLAGLLLAATLSAGCAATGPFTWYSELPKTEWSSLTGEYVIAPGDTVNIRVYQQEGISGSAKVRRDGRIALPLVGEVAVAGKHPLELANELETRLKEYIVAPRVTVNVEQSQPVTVTVIGEVARVGALTLEPPGRLVDAVAQAGGPNDFADKSRIFVLRQFPKFQRIRFTYDSILRNEGGAASFPLRTGDVIVME